MGWEFGKMGDMANSNRKSQFISLLLENKENQKLIVEIIIKFKFNGSMADKFIILERNLHTHSLWEVVSKVDMGDFQEKLKNEFVGPKVVDKL